ncbi:hypothetical protein SAMN06272721_103203 [Arthrobacter sp. P2b]|nr:hypothetical protein SAMN06272721_103203 [Arthrobacter sp. P2b]
MGVAFGRTNGIVVWDDPYQDANSQHVDIDGQVISRPVDCISRYNC